MDPSPLQLYEDLWVRQILKLEAAIKSGESYFPRLVNQIILPKVNYSNIRSNNSNSNIVPFADYFYESTYPNNAQLMLFYQTKYSLFRSFIDSFNHVDWILELGSGIGDNLYDLWLTSKHPNAKYIGAEYTQAGRIFSERIVSFAENFDFEAKYFDYYNTQVQDIAPKDGVGIVFTCYSIEQIPFIPKDFLLNLASLPNLLACLHLEPISWQLESILPQDQLQIHHTSGVSDKSITDTMRERSIESKYNQNFGLLLNNACKAEIIKLAPEFSFRYFTAHRFDMYASSVAWRSNINAP